MKSQRYLALVFSLVHSLSAATDQAGLIDQGLEAYKAGNYDLAIDRYSQALKENPTNPIAYNVRALAYKAKKDYPHAIADFSAALRLKSDWYLYYNRASAYSDQGDEKAAIADLSKALKTVPKSSVGLIDCLLARAHSYFNENQPDLAMSDLNRAIKSGVKEPDAYVLRGILFKGRHDYVHSLADYEKAISLDPKDPRSYDVEAYLLSVCPMPKFRDGPKAIAYATKACELSNWKSAMRLETLAAAYAENRQFEEAIKWQQKAIALDPKEAEQTRLTLYQQKKPFRDLNRKESAISDISDLTDKVQVQLGHQVQAEFKVTGDKLIAPTLIPVKAKRLNAVFLNFYSEKSNHILRLSHSFSRTMVARCLARLQGYDAYFETDILPVEVRSISPELWQEPIEELVLFDFKLTGPEAQPAMPESDQPADVASGQTSFPMSFPIRNLPSVSPASD